MSPGTHAAGSGDDAASPSNLTWARGLRRMCPMTADCRAPELQPLCVGAVVAHRYELVRLIGRGSMGEVWLAHHRALGENVALKVIVSSLCFDSPEGASGVTTRFRLEAQLTARLARKTRHIVCVTDYGDTDGLAYIVMELLEGATFEQELSRRCRMAPGEVQQIVRQIARALCHAHAEGILHRDLKPSNVFLTRDEDGHLLVKVLDFGVASIVPPRGVFSTGGGLVFGTAGYMSPEQASGAATLDARCDLWALATMAYQALTGALPIEGDSIDELMRNVCALRMIPFSRRRSDLPPAVGAFFDRAFAERIDARFSNASEFVEAFDRTLSPAGKWPTRGLSMLAQTGARRGVALPALAMGVVMAAGATASWRSQARALDKSPSAKASVVVPSPESPGARAAIASDMKPGRDEARSDARLELGSPVGSDLERAHKGGRMSSSHRAPVPVKDQAAPASPSAHSPKISSPAERQPWPRPADPSDVL
jgi:eukaryotic-like serine/threonine-protein kinase